MRYRPEDDDDFPPLSRQDIVILRNLLIKIEEAGVIQFLTEQEIAKLRQFSGLMETPGMAEAMLEQASRRAASAHWMNVRAKWFRAMAYLAAGTSTMIGIVLGLDQVAKAIRDWLR